MDADLPGYSSLEAPRPFFAPFSPNVSEARLPIHRPANLARSGFHALTGVFALALIQVTSHRVLCAIAISAAIGCWFLEATRQRVPWINRLCMWVLGRFAHPHEIAGAFAYLGSDEAAYVTGSIFSIDGAITA